MLLLEEGVPSTLRRTAGFDVPDFLAAGPRDVLVPESGVEVAREVLLRERDRPDERHERGAGASRPSPAALLVGDRRRAGRALVLLASALLGLSWPCSARPVERDGAAAPGELLEVRAPARARPRRAACSNAASSAASARVELGLARQAHAGLDAALAREQVEQRAAERARRRGGVGGQRARPLAQPARDRRAQVRKLAREVLGRSLRRARRSAAVPRACAGRKGGGSSGLLLADDQHRVGALRREHAAPRASPARRPALRRHLGRERVHLAGVNQPAM